jgi:hypothetical protein
VQLRILPSAFEDLDRGSAFYAQHGEELGDYFLDSLFADIDSLALTQASTFGFGASAGCWPSGFRTRSTTESMLEYVPSRVSWSAEAARAECDRHYDRVAVDDIDVDDSTGTEIRPESDPKPTRRYDCYRAARLSG